ncbi:MAG TPA: hypothetical protein VMS93_12820 [Candidatus Saccharimonadales bacterium]|nr:hypothetical protein [Candidatus Saccharimonadales bacterium]
MYRNTARGSEGPKRKGGGEGDEHWLENLEQGRRGLEPEDLEGVRDLDDEELFDDEEELEEDEGDEDVAH